MLTASVQPLRFLPRRTWWCRFGVFLVERRHVGRGQVDTLTSGKSTWKNHGKHREMHLILPCQVRSEANKRTKQDLCPPQNLKVNRTNSYCILARPSPKEVQLTFASTDSTVALSKQLCFFPSCMHLPRHPQPLHQTTWCEDEENIVEQGTTGTTSFA